MVRNTIFLQNLNLTKVSATEDGMHVDVSAQPGSTAAEYNTSPLLSFRSEREGVIQMLVHFPTHDLAIPLSEIKRAIQYVEKEVHSEAYYLASSDGSEADA